MQSEAFSLLDHPELETLAQQGPEQRSRRGRLFDDRVEWAQPQSHQPAGRQPGGP